MTTSSTRVQRTRPVHPSAQDICRTDVLIVRDKLKHILTPYTLMRARKQAALSSQYNVELVAGQESVALRERKWRVGYIPSTAQGAAAADGEGEPVSEVGVDGDGTSSMRVPASIFRAYHGLDQDFTCHEVTLESCSCQLPRCSDLPDRHQIAVWQQLLSTGQSLGSIDFNIEGMLAETWLLRNHTEAQVRVATDLTRASRAHLDTHRPC
jgi:hypothetical protein